MIGSSHKTSEDLIIEYLAKRPQTAENIHKNISKKRSISLQAVYDQLRKLVDSGVLLKTKTKYVLSSEWTEKLRSLFVVSNGPIINEGESMTYTFKNLKQSDAFWKHVFNAYGQSTIPVCMYNHHCFWLYLYEREQSEIDHYHSYKKKKQTAFFLIGSETSIDFEFKKQYGDNNFKVNCKKTKIIKSVDHITVMGDIIINSQVPESIAKKIDNLYERREVLGQDFIDQINGITESITKVTFKIERNYKKAAALQKIITRDFVILAKDKKQLLF